MALTKKAERTKAKLLASARELIGERGFDNVSVEEITKHCGVAKGTFYHYFECKEDVIGEISFKSFHNLVEEAIAADIPTAEKMKGFILALMKEASWTGVYIIRQWMRDVMDPRTEKTGNAAVEVGFGEISSIIQSGVDRGELKKSTPVAALTQLFLAHIYGSMTVWCMVGGKDDIVKSTELVIGEYVDNMLGKYVKKV